VQRVAVAGNFARDRVDGGPPSPGGCPFFAAEALRRLGREGQIVSRYAPEDAELFEPGLAALGRPVTLLPAERTSGFALDYVGEERAMTVTAAGTTWQPGDADALDSRVEWIHVAPILRSDFPADALAALAAGRKLSLDGQGLVRAPRLGPLTLDADYDPAMLDHVTVLKLAEEEAHVVAGGPFDKASAHTLGVPEVLLTLGSHGAVVFADGTETFVPASPPVLGVQTTGAGDVFMVGYVVARCDGLDPVAAAKSASRLVAEMLDERKRARQ
jgi:sugar/nucleoside kinase (ribokinase family)